MIRPFEYNLDIENLEIFPKEIWEDPYVVFHGTSEYHSTSIEQNGWVKSYNPFNISEAKELVRVLEIPRVRNFDRANSLGSTIADTLKNYINTVERGFFRLSFSYLSYQGVLFSEGKSKGGQTFGNVRIAKEIIEAAITSNQASQSIITAPILKLFQQSEEIENAKGIVYAIKLPETLDGITEEYGVLHSDVSIPKELIIGKVILPDSIDLNLVDSKLVKNKNKSKLIQPGHLGVILGKRKYLT